MNNGPSLIMAAPRTKSQAGGRVSSHSEPGGSGGGAPEEDSPWKVSITAQSVLIACAFDEWESEQR